MTLELQPITDQGRAFVALAEEHAAEAAEQAARHDAEGSFPTEVFESMRKSKFLAAPVPVDRGGLGLESLHDICVGVGRLGRGDGSVAIAAQMHLASAFGFSLRMRQLERQNDPQRLDDVRALVDRIGSGTIVATIGSEAGHDLVHLMTELTLAGDTVTVAGRKNFGTLSPMADILLVTGRFRDSTGTWRLGVAAVPTRARGVEVKNNWDAMGMRGSGSHDIVFDNAPAIGFFPGSRWGRYSSLQSRYSIIGNGGLIAAFLGIAEAARDLAVQMVRARKKQDHRAAQERGIHRLVGEMDVELATCRALVERFGRNADALLLNPSSDGIPDEKLTELDVELQCAKLVVQRKAIGVVDSALTVSGGFGYLNRSSLSRLYRDVRAGPFMQPYSPLEAPEFIGRVALGLSPNLDD